MSEKGSVTSIESIFSEGLPASPSLLYDQRHRLYETCKKQGRKAITEYARQKSRTPSPVYHTTQKIFDIGLVELPSLLYSK
jgi:predicted transcriptional regulator